MSYVASKTLPFSVELYRQLKRKRTAFAYGFVVSLPILVAIAVKFGPSGNSGGPTRLGSGTADLIGLATIGAANFHNHDALLCYAILARNCNRTL
jgi:ABC-2 type transport system permease protein